MKKSLTLLTLLSILGFQAQVPFNFDNNGTNLANGSTSYLYEINSFSDFRYNITNESENPLSIRAQVIGLSNYQAGQSMQFCFEYSCYETIALNAIYPISSEDAFVLQPDENMNTAAGNICKFYNTSPGTDPNAIKEFVIRFYAENPDTNAQVGDSFILTYRYNPNLNTINQTLENLGVQLQSTLVNNQIEVNCKEKTQMTLVDITGKTLLNFSLSEGNNTIDANFLNAGVYVLSFETSSNKKASQKIIKK